LKFKGLRPGYFSYVSWKKEPNLKPASITILLTFFLFSTAYSQHQNNNWYYGRNAGLNFNTSPPSPIYSNLVSTEGTAAISDPLGNLLFYTDGLTVWGRTLTHLKKCIILNH
jgi:hypothetical protein